MNFKIVFDPVLTLIIPFFVGMIYFKIFKPQKNITKDISTFLFNIAAPCATFNSVINANISDFNSDFIKCIILGASISVISYIIGLFLSKAIAKDNMEKGIIQFSMLFSNFMFMAYPVISMILGEEYLIYATAFNLLTMILVPSFGVYMIVSTKKSNEKTFDFKLTYIFNPLIVGLILGFIVKFANIPLYTPIKEAINLFATTTAALSMFMSGILLIRTGILKPLKSWQVYVDSFFRLIVLPLITYCIAKMLGLPLIFAQVAGIVIAMPTATNCVMYCENFDVKSDYAAGLVFVNSILCVLTCPLVMLLAEKII